MLLESKVFVPFQLHSNPLLGMHLGGAGAVGGGALSTPSAGWGDTLSSSRTLTHRMSREDCWLQGCRRISPPQSVSTRTTSCLCTCSRLGLRIFVVWLRWASQKGTSESVLVSLRRRSLPRLTICTLLSTRLQLLPSWLRASSEEEEEGLQGAARPLATPLPLPPARRHL